MCIHPACHVYIHTCWQPFCAFWSGGKECITCGGLCVVVRCGAVRVAVVGGATFFGYPHSLHNTSTPAVLQASCSVQCYIGLSRSNQQQPRKQSCQQTWTTAARAVSVGCVDVGVDVAAVRHVHLYVPVVCLHQRCRLPSPRSTSSVFLQQRVCVSMRQIACAE